MSLGTTIKKLRREKDITQEQLAEYLGITSRAISQWECDRTSPDISQIPVLCNIFEVSSDELLGIDVSNKNKQIDELYNEMYQTAADGNQIKAVELAEKALILYPSSYKLMDFYANEIFLYNNTFPIAVQENNKNKAVLYIEKILNECTDSEIRNNCLSMACLWYPKIGRTAEAEKLAKMLEGMNYTCGELLGKMYTGKKQFEVIRDEAIRQFTNVLALIDDLISTCDDDGNRIYTDDEVLQLNQMCIDMIKLYFPNGDYFFLAQDIEGAYRQMADIYATRKDTENTIACLNSATDYAIYFDILSTDSVHTSPVAKGIECGEIWWHDGHNNSHNLLEKLISEKYTQYDFIRESEAFGSILTKLKGFAK